jgi:hypothetical protein
MSATRCRMVECTQTLTLSTRHVPAGSLRGRAAHALCGWCEAPRTMYRIGFKWRQENPSENPPSLRARDE